MTDNGEPEALVQPSSFFVDTRHEKQAPAPAPRSKPQWQRFDAAWYKSRHPELTTEIAGTDPAAWEAFYWEAGCRRGHSPNMFFDEEWYLATYADVAAYVGSGGARSGFEHYCNDGYRDRAPHWLFDETTYRDGNGDLPPGLLDRSGYRNGYAHFIAEGDAQGRTGHRFFDPAVARAHNAEGAVYGPDAANLFALLLASRFRSSATARLSWYFDPEWYLHTYPDVVSEVDAGRWTCALHHYLCNSTPSRFEPNRWFSESFYAATYKDVSDALAAGGFRNGYAHFLKHGAKERRKPHPEVDLVRYFQSRKVQIDLRRGNFPDAFAHWVAAQEALADPADLMPVREGQSKRLTVKQSENMLLQFVRAKIDFTLPEPRPVGGEPRVSVIMIVYNKFALTMGALASLRSCYPGEIELLFVDSGSTDETEQIERYVSGLKRIRFEHNVGFLEGCNTALAQATGDVVLYLNNDLTLGLNALKLALARLMADESVGAVGGKIIRSNGMLQEAGSIVWRDGSTAGYLRDAHPDLPEANFVRDVDFCSGAFLLLRRSVLERLGGFDEDFKPAYYEETDLCVRLRKLGLRIVYDPAVVVQHLEFGSSGSSRSQQMIRRNHALFVEKHLDWLRFQYPPRPRNAVFARSPRSHSGRILFFEDRVPMRSLGSGYVRSNDIVRTMAELGHHVSVYPIYPPAASAIEVYADFPETVEVLHDRGLDELPAFIEERAGYYDTVWIGRTHNLPRLLPILGDAAVSLPDHSFILDTEAVAASRTVEQARVLGLPQDTDLDVLLKREFAPAYFCQKIIAVNERDASSIRQSGHRNVAVLGHMVEPRPTPRTWAERSGLLFLGAFHEESSPNYDSLKWFNSEVLPLLRDRLPDGVRFSIAGHVDNSRVNMAPLGQDARVDLLGEVDDPAVLYASHRVFIAPTRFAGGIPFKVHEAAAHGVPVVASALLCDQVGWTDGIEILSGGTMDPARFADQIVALYTQADLWDRVRNQALERIRLENTPDAYRTELSAILRDVRESSEASRRSR